MVRDPSLAAGLPDAIAATYTPPSRVIPASGRVQTKIKGHKKTREISNRNGKMSWGRCGKLQK